MRLLGIVVAAAGCVAVASSALATEQIYRPVSPTFGGNPLNGNFLLSTAQAQGNGVKSGNQGPDLSGLSSALSGIGSGAASPPIVVIGGNGLPVVPASP
ncbi:MAG: curli assembly protein CsgF [Rhizobiales bacterium 62-47]|nr:curli assembly protein CsgF [Hyphomicrobiales bacterium]OJY09864.1 MAG: curli assembly protein CsgF [Rhizobiales bacterium 62-47]